jgi:hypothetical protein
LELAVRIVAVAEQFSTRGKFQTQLKGKLLAIKFPPTMPFFDKYRCLRGFGRVGLHVGR